MGKMVESPDRPVRVSVKQGRKGQHSKKEPGDKTISLDSANKSFEEGTGISRGGRDMSTIPTKPSTKKNGGTRQSRIQRGRQQPL